MESNKTSRTTIPAAAMLENPACGRDVHSKMVMVRVVNLEKGPVGSVVMKVEAPTTMRGAVSPKARETDRMVPVKMPPTALGKTWCQMVCHLVAPRP